MKAFPSRPRSWAGLGLRLLVALVAAVPPYLVLASSSLGSVTRVLVAMLVYVPGVLAMMWASRRY